MSIAQWMLFPTKDALIQTDRTCAALGTLKLSGDAHAPNDGHCWISVASLIASLMAKSWRFYRAPGRVAFMEVFRSDPHATDYHLVQDLCLEVCQCHSVGFSTAVLVPDRMIGGEATGPSTPWSTAKGPSLSGGSSCL